jgi:perosamine synthetase
MATVVTTSVSVPPTGRRIAVAGPSISEHEVDLVADAVRSAWYEDANTVVDGFERSFATHVGRRHAIALPSCTSALHLILAALGIGPGDEVVVPDATWIATAAPIAYVGATPVFADVDPVTWCIDAHSVERVLSARTRAVIAVDLYGGMPDYEALTRLCADRGVTLIEDAAEAIGSSWQERPAGGFGVAAAFSFHGSKTLTTGEGGMLVTDDDALHARALMLRDHGRRPGDVEFFNDEVAFKYKMSAMQAALGQAQLDRLAELVDAKRQVFAWYRDRMDRFVAEGSLVLNAEPPGTRNSYWMTTAVFDADTGLTGAAVAQALDAAGIATRPFFHPLHRIPAYAETAEAARAADANPISRRLGTFGINLPSALRLTEDEVAYVCSQLEQLLPRAG